MNPSTVVDVVLNPAEIALLSQRDLSRATCVVFDVLRATSSMITGLAHGATEIYPVRTVEEAFALKKRMPESILGGERHGDLIAGFDIGNSPLEYLNLTGRKIITTTTNGTIGLRSCEGAARVLVGAILNIDALVLELQQARPPEVVIVCAGTFADFALEDAIAAGILAGALGHVEFTDSAYAALALARTYPDPLEALRIARNGRVLVAKGRDEEVKWCAQQSRFNIVGSMEQAVIRPLPTHA
jgi:2-phosphosulfolactate phosphatase